jgi:hypothetical protein
MMASPRGCLVIIFNHPYPANVGKLKQIYASRFARVIFLMPLEQMNDADVFTVYRGAYTFHGFIADAWRLLSTIDAEFFVFAGDDVLINPAFGERELYERLYVDRFDGYIPHFRSLSVQSAQVGKNFDDETANLAAEAGDLWFWTERVLSRMHPAMSVLFGSGCAAAWRYLPSSKEALNRFAAFGMAALTSPDNAPEAPENFALRLARRTRRAIRSRLCGSQRDPLARLRQDLPYPMAYGVSDFFVVRSDALMKFSRYCGTLAALDIFVEAAIPTALVLACDKLGTGSDTSLHCRWTWTGSNVHVGVQAAADYATICREFDDHLLFIHPVKFSQIAM